MTGSLLNPLTQFTRHFMADLQVDELVLLHVIHAGLHVINVSRRVCADVCNV